MPDRAAASSIFGLKHRFCSTVVGVRYRRDGEAGLADRDQVASARPCHTVAIQKGADGQRENER